MEIRVLIVEDSDDDAELIAAELRRAGFSLQYKRVETAEALNAALDEEFDLIISDFSLPQFSAPRALEIVGPQALHTVYCCLRQCDRTNGPASDEGGPC